MRAICFCAALLFASPVCAQSRVELAPIRLQLAPEKPLSSIRLRNTSDAPIAFSANAMRWTQTNGEDVLTPTPDIIVSPPSFVIAPGREQIVRIGAKRVKSGTEQAFRLLFSEQKLSAAGDSEGLSVRLELSLPIFVGAPGKPDALDVEFVDAGATRLLRLANNADGHIMLADAHVGAVGVNLPRYLLAGARLERPAPSNSDHLTVQLVQADQLVQKEYRLVADAQSHGAAGR